MNELALFAGAGGGVLGSRLLGWRTVCYVEQDPYCVAVIKQRIRDGALDDAPIWDDVTTFDGRPWAGRVDIVSGGFPCQPWSLANKRAKGPQDERNLWPDTIRIVGEVRPRWLLLENVPGLLAWPYIRRIFADLAECGCDARWDCIPAAYVGAPHLRYRLWILGNSNEPRLAKRESKPKDDGSQQPPSVRASWWTFEPGLGRVADGVPNRMERLRAIGNGQVPAVVRIAWLYLNQSPEV